MSFTSENSKRVLIADGVETEFDFNFLVYEADHLGVYIDGVIQTSGYTVTGLEVDAGGTVTFNVAPAALAVITLNLEVPYTQELDYQTGGKFPATSHEKGLDLITMLAKRLKEVDTRTLLAPIGGDNDEDMALPTQADRASKYLAFDTDGNPVATAGTTSDLIATPFIETLLDDATAMVARGTLDAAERGWEIQNYTFTTTVSANALTVAVKTDLNSDPSPTSKVLIRFPSTVLGTQGSYSELELTAALSVVVSTGSTLGTVSGVANRIYVGIANDGGTPRLFLYNPTNSLGNVVNLLDSSVYSSTAEGGAGAADSAQVLYSTVAFTSKNIRIIGFIESTQATAGTWATNPSKSILLPHRSPEPVVPSSMFSTTRGDYEQGTWTPSVGGNATYTTQAGTYVRVGRMVTVTLNMVINVLGTGSADIVSGLPFTPAASVVGACYWAGAAGAFVTLIAVGLAATTTVQFISAAAATATIAGSTIFQNGTTVITTLTYQI